MTTISDRQLRESYQNTNEKDQSGGYPSYEVGSFTARLEGTSSGSIKLISSASTLNYIKIGNLMNVFGRLVIASPLVSDAIGQLVIRGFPYNQAGGVNARSVANFYVNNDPFGTDPAVTALLLSISGNAELRLYRDGGDIPITHNDLVRGGDLYFSSVYMV